MAKFPQWTATVDPTAGGPLIVRQPNAGQTGMAMAQLGQTIAGVGQYLTAEGRQAAERTAELDRIRQASTITRQATSKLRKFSDEIRRDPDPANYERRFEEVSSSILAGLDAIEDPEVCTRAQVKIDSELDFHQRDMLTWRMQAQQKAFEQEYLQAEQDAVRTGNVEAVETPLQALVDAGFTTPEQAARAKSVVEAKTIVWQTALAKGWTEGLKYATDPETLAELPLSPEERKAFKAELESYLASEETLEQLAARKEAERIERDKTQLFADAYSEKLTDPGQIDQALRAGVLSPTEAKQLYELMKKGPPAENDPQASAEAYDLVADVQFGRTQPETALRQLDKMASKLTPAFRDARIKDLTSTGPIDTAMRDITQAARRELVTTTQDLMTVMMTSGAGPDALAALDNEKNRQERLVNYHDDQMRRWLREHPEASEDDLYVESRRILARVRSMDVAGRESLLESWEQQVLTPAASPWEGPNEGVIPLGSVAPQGLETVWDTMTTEEKQTALSALANGTATVEQIREMLQ